ncbi:MAG: molybdate transporter family protein [Thermoleophilaceae bacterium]
MTRLGEVRFDRRELAGGLGDAGLFIPIAVALVAVNGLSATAVFAGAGLTYIATALYFGVPIPVQPLKAFAAAAIALQLEAEVLAAGALLMAVAMAVLAATGMAGWLAARFPVVLIRGIQASVAFLLVKAAVDLAERGNWDGLPAVSTGLSLAAAAGACALLFLLGRHRTFPGTLVVLGAGMAAGIAVAGGLPPVAAGPQAVELALPDAAAFVTALTTLVVAQIPLTFGNAVVATADAERSYFGERAARVRPNRLAASIAGANALAGATSGLPTCHGAGGVTAHARLGARTAGATLFTGALYLSLGLVFGASLPGLLQLLLPGALAGMLLFVAVQHGLLAAQLERLPERGLAAGIGLITLATGNLAIGFGVGVAVLAAARAGRALGRRPRLAA